MLNKDKPKADSSDETSRRKAEWERRFSESCRDFEVTNPSGRKIKPLYGPSDTGSLKYEKDLGFPGEYPFTRGVYTTMYRSRLWTMRQFSGYGTARDSNRRYHFLLGRGQTGLSVAFDMPTIMGYDSDHPRSHGEVGMCGVAIDSLRDMEILFDGIPLDKVSTSMTINAPAAMLLAFYICVGEKQGVPSEQLRGTIQNDILKEYIAQKSWIFPPGPSMRIITDILAFCTDHVPKWNTISVSGYHIREAGSTASQELAFTLADGFAYVEAGIKAGLDVDAFAPRLSFFFNSHLDFFEEIAKYRAARRIWARTMKDKYGAKKKASLLMRFHTQTAGCTLTAQQPENNIIRTAYEAMAASLGGTQSLHTNSMDETLGLPTEKAAQIALRTQQILAYETGVANTIDPLAGSYYVEHLTNKLEEEAREYFRKIEDLGGVAKAIDLGFFQKEISDAAYRYQKEIEEKTKTVVGVNEYVIGDEKIEIDILEVDPRVEEGQSRALKQLRAERDNVAAKSALDELRRAAEGTENIMPKILNCSRTYCTLGEMIGVLRGEFGEYKEPIIY
jgi:methylmalonyl-CoA mutase N-terminal domain/subunit